MDSVQPIKVLMVVPNLRVSNGVASFAMNYFRKLDRRRVHMDFCLINDIDTVYYDEIAKAGSRYYILPSFKKPLELFRSIRRILAEGQYEVIHNSVLLAGLPLMLFARIKKIPVRILHSHNSKLGESEIKEKRNSLFLPLLIKQANAYAACSDMAAKALFNNAYYKLIPNCIDPSKFLFNDDIRKHVRDEMGSAGKRIIVTVGRIAAQKNPFFALDVFDLVNEKDPQTEYWWIGSGPLDIEVKDYADKSKHGNNVRFLGNRNDMNEIYNAADLFFLPSLFEGLPITVVEAQATGLPCILSDSITHEMVYTDLVEYYDLKASKEVWAEYICKRIMNERSRNNYNDALINSRFSNRNAGGYLEQYYRELLYGNEEKG